MSVVVEVEEKPKFDAGRVAMLVKELRKSFNAGRTRSFEWRVSQLKSIEKMLEEKRRRLLKLFLRTSQKPGLEAFCVISQVKSSCKLALKRIESLDDSRKAGNAVVLKPSEIAPATSLLVSNFAEEYLDNSAIKAVEGAIDETTALLDQKWDGILYTGSARVGRIVMATAAVHLTPITLELGGKCPAVVDSNANLQKDTPTILLDVPEDSLIMQEKKFGPLVPILIVSTIVILSTERCYFAAQSALLIVTVENLEDNFEVINSKPKPLAAYLFTNDEQLKKAFVQNISLGGMLINDTIIHVVVEGLPFGGVGESGMGSYHGKFSFDAFSHKKAVLYRSFDGDASVRYPPYTPEKQKLLKALISGNIIAIILALIGWSKD
ncbi:aldehyde dehydrogenase family 3 member I1, chloroplastic-like [Juglans regia]|uniref:Aldehyde dehydrogenase family 3 member I1, chloroplastic-like n=1 Tax=Juglans regia TaxID=51240 RepID=A0A6P9F8Q4_JUGRE|nr:aldehyde dehydrogenase family 3 member I1, chloroplastic-like [Juglans regia]